MPWFAYLIFAFMIVCLVLSVYRLRRGGPGPAMNYLPRSLRPMANAYYRRMGWQEPFDVDGDRNPLRGKL
jgi:hypothetical protein